MTEEFNVQRPSRIRLIRGLLSQNGNYAKFRHVVDPNHFPTKEEALLIRTVDDFYGTYKRMPDKAELTDALKRRPAVDDNMADDLLEEVYKCNDISKPILDSYIKFAHLQTLRAEMVTMWEAAEIGDVDKMQSVAHKVANMTIPTAGLKLQHYKPETVDIEEVCPWLVDADDFVSKWSPRTPYPMRMAALVQLLSMVNAGRTFLPGMEKHCMLYTTITAPTTLYAKTVGIRRVMDIFKKAAKLGLDTSEMLNVRHQDHTMKHLIETTFSTPEAFFQSRCIKKQLPTIAEWLALDKNGQEHILAELAFVGQRSISWSEFGSKFVELKSNNPTLQQWGDHFLKIMDDEEEYERRTIAHKLETIYHPYTGMLITMTPEAFIDNPNGYRASNGNNKLWNNGFLPRELFATPMGCEPIMESWPREEYEVPDKLAKPLRDWHNRLGCPDINIFTTDYEDDKGKKMQKLDYSWRMNETRLNIAQDAYEHLYGNKRYPVDHPLHYGYSDALALHARQLPSELHGSYGRFAEQAHKIAGLIASFQDSAEIQLKHVQLAIQLVETIYRPCLHEVYNYDKSIKSTAVITNNLEEAIRQQLEAKGKLSINELRRYMNLGKDDVELLKETVTIMVETGEISMTVEGKTKKAERFSLAITA